jgi:hypothetical protein
MCSFLRVAKKLSATALSIEAIAAASHRDGDAGVAVGLSDRQRHELRSLVAVMHESGLGPAAMQGHLQRVDDELGTHVVGHRPADDQPRVEVLQRHEVAAALPGLQ